MKHFLVLVMLFVALICDASAASVKVTMNATSTTMKLMNKADNSMVDVGEPTSRVYTFEAPAGTYVLTGIATDGKTENGTIEINVTDEAEQEFTILTCTAYVTNQTDYGTTWAPDTDYTLDVKVNSREGEAKVVTVGNSTTDGRKTFLALNGNSYIVTFNPSEEHAAEGYLYLIKSGTLTAGVNVAGKIPLGGDFTITLPSDAHLFLGLKYVHFTDFTEVSPESEVVEGDVKKVTYHLADSQVYNYRTWRENGLTQAGYFTMSTTKSKCPTVEFTDESYQQFGSKQIVHDVNNNMGYETGDIFVNINEKGYLNLNVGEEYYAHAMRTWQLTDTQTNNYFMEPDFHYTILDVDGKPSEGVITIDNADTTTSPWSKITAVGEGTAIVLVTYDAIGVNYYKQTAKTAYMGGEYWSAIWPENTAAYVVTVGNKTSSVMPNMTINKNYNVDTKKNAGTNVDAEHDVFYYLDTEEGFNYTFTPENVNTIEIAYPTIGEQMATYTGFSTEGVTKNDDGSYTLLLKHGRQIVRLTDAAGASTYQVLTAKQCHREIVNLTRDGSNVFIPGDQVKVQYTGLFHPANKLSGIYNMSAYVTYNGVPNGTSLILGSGQYTFGSAASAQAVTVTIPKDFDTDTQSEIVMDEGVIQVNGYGDPIGNHRIISRTAGRSPNFTAVAHKTYFGAIPEVTIPVTKTPKFNIIVNSNVDDAEITVYFQGTAMTANSDGTYTGTIGSYAVTGVKDGYRYYHNAFVIEDDAEGDQQFQVALVAAGEGVWDGKTMTEPTQDDEGVYQITSGAELAWFSNEVTINKQVALKGVLVNDIDLGDYPWSAIAGASVVAYNGTFDGQGNSVNGLYINNTKEYQGLFGYIYGTASVSNITVRGDVTGGKSTGGVVGGAASGAKIDRCVNHATVSSAGQYTGGIVGYLNGAATTVTNCYNLGNVSGTASCGGIAGYTSVASIVVKNCYNAGEVTGTSYVAGCVGGSYDKNGVSNVYTTNTYTIVSTNKGDNSVVVTDDQLASGEVAYKLGDAFGQEIGVDAYPVLGGLKVYYDESTNTYSNGDTTGVEEIALDNAATVAGYYDINGRRLSEPQRGLNIVVMTDGTVKKQIVK